jgi:hypothetical protein
MKLFVVWAVSWVCSHLIEKLLKTCYRNALTKLLGFMVSEKKNPNCVHNTAYENSNVMGWHFTDQLRILWTPILVFWESVCPVSWNKAVITRMTAESVSPVYIPWRYQFKKIQSHFMIGAVELVNQLSYKDTNVTVLHFMLMIQTHLFAVQDF